MKKGLRKLSENDGFEGNSNPDNESTPSQKISKPGMAIASPCCLSAHAFTSGPTIGENKDLRIEAARRDYMARVARRLVDPERKMITSGSVLIFDEGESGIKLWTDGFVWRPSSAKFRDEPESEARRLGSLA